MNLFEARIAQRRSEEVAVLKTYDYTLPVESVEPVTVPEESVEVSVVLDSEETVITKKVNKKKSGDK